MSNDSQIKGLGIAQSVINLRQHDEDTIDGYMQLEEVTPRVFSEENSIIEIYFDWKRLNWGKGFCVACHS